MSADATGARAAVILADTATLPQAAARWRELVPNLGTMPETELGTVKLPLDPATYSLFLGLIGWVLIGGFLPEIINKDADAFVAWVDNATKVFNISDQDGADQISRSIGPTLGMKQI